MSFWLRNRNFHHRFRHCRRTFCFPFSIIRWKGFPLRHLRIERIDAQFLQIKRLLANVFDQLLKFTTHALITNKYKLNN